VNGHVHEDTAGNLDIAHRLVIGIAGGDLDEIGLAQLAGSDRIADGLVVVVKAANEADLQLNACLLYRSEGFLDLCQLGVDRLLTEDVLAGLRSAHDEVCMRCGGGADEHGLDGRIAKDHLGIIVALLNTHVRCPCAGRIVHERISHCVEICVRYGMCQIFAVQLADSACTQQTDSYLVCHFFLHSFFTLKPELTRLLKKQYIRSFFLCFYDIIIAHREEQCKNIE